MSGAYFMAREDVETAPSFAALPWACTGCRACKSACDHKNPVAETLTDARTALFALGLEPPAARKVTREYAAKQADLSTLVARAKSRHSLPDAAPAAILVGCTYFRKLPQVADDAISASVALSGPCTLASSCCGASLGMAGDRDGQRAALQRLAEETRGTSLLVVADPGCAYAIKHSAPALGVRIDPRVTTLVELAEKNLTRLTRLAGPAGAAPFFQDPCHLGRGLGLFAAPRAILTQLFGAPPRELRQHGEDAVCSGAGGLLPLTMPDVSQSIARTRTEEIRGEMVVTACASSLRAFRKAGADAQDLSTLIARGLGVSPHEARER